MAAAAQQITSETAVNPLTVNAFFAIPRIVGLLKNVNDAEFRLLSILYSAFGDDGHIEFKIRTLAAMMHKAASSVRRIIDSCESKNLIRAYQTGRSLQFELIIDEKPTLKRVPKNDQAECSKISTHYHSRKEIYKNNNNKPSATKPAPEKPASAIAAVRKNIDPEIAMRLSDNTIAGILKVPITQIRQASNEAMAANVERKPGLFLKIIKETPAGSSVFNPSSIPDNASAEQIKCIQCYNSNCEKEIPTCATIKPNDQGVRHKPYGLCAVYCPFVLANEDLF